MIAAYNHSNVWSTSKAYSFAKVMQHGVKFAVTMQSWIMVILRLVGRASLAGCC